MLDLRPCCECCGADLAPDAAGAFICSFECTFCRSCRDGPLNGRCPNCGGELQPRPARPTAALLAYPATTQRIVKSDGCSAVAPRS